MAARFWIGGGTTTNWNASPTTNWSATSGGAVRVAAPTASDTVTFDGAGANGNTASVVSAAGACLTLTFTAGYTNTITINTGINLAVSGNFTDNTAHTWVVNGTGLLTINAASTITSNGKTFPGPVTLSGSNTKTISGDWTITGTLTTATTTTTVNKTTNETITCAGWSVGGTTTGTINITVTGGTWIGASVVNTVSGTITFSGSSTISGVVRINGCTLNYGSGTITTTGSTLQIDGSCTLNTAGITWNNITVQGSATITNNSLLTATGALSFSNGTAPTFAGTTGWTVGTITDNHLTSNTISLKNGLTYTITTAFNASQSRLGSIVIFASDDATLKAILTLNQGATCNVLANFTRIDASAGRPINTWNGTVTTCFNINSFTDTTALGAAT